MEAKIPEIVFGESICEKIKNLYFQNMSWIECNKLVAFKFTELKRLSRKFYTDLSDNELLKILNKYSVEDIKEAFEIDQ